MSDYITGNPLGSIDPRDLDDNATIFDNLLNSLLSVVPDRFGVPRKTWHQMELDAATLVSPNVQAFAALTGAADRVPYFTGLGALALAVLTTVGRTLIAASTQAEQRTALGLGSAAVLTAGAASGVATLGGDGKVPVSQLPALAINETFTVASQAAMLALTAERGDVAIRSDLAGAAYLLTADAPATLANWVPIQQNLAVALTALAALTPAADKIPYFTGSATSALADFTAAARTLLAAASPATQRSAMGVKNVSSRYIEGLELQWGASAITVLPGSAAMVDTGLPLELAASATISLTGLTSGTWYHVYLYLVGTTATLELSATAPVLAASGGYQKTGDATRRYVGSVLANGSTSVYPFVQDGTQVHWNVTPNVAPFALLSVVPTTTPANVSAAGCAPATAVSILAQVSNLDPSLNSRWGNPTMGTVSTTNFRFNVTAGGSFITEILLGGTLQFSYVSDGSATGAITCRTIGYKFKR